MTTSLYFALLIVVALGRLIELRLSKRNQARLRAAGSEKASEPGYFWMVAFHTALLVGSAVEVLAGDRPFLPWLGFPALAVFLLANAMRWWVIQTLGARWNTEVMAPSLGVIATGPYRFVRHPNYSVVFLEMLALPLIHTAWITAALGAVAHVLVLRKRVSLEERVMLKNPTYREAFGRVPRFIPRIW